MHNGRIAAMGTVQELKATFAGRSLVEVRTPSPMEALRALDGLPGVQKTSLFGTALHVLLGAGVGDTRFLSARLAERGLSAESIGLVQPSLEDVFMDVVERATADAGGAS
jgi:hypothetical protein